ncbi:MAG: hypothetical protein PF542_01055 [Nanoarchaeota archaeon]|nr:hypothetical protein [Nanoarchaeota archaeon]
MSYKTLEHISEDMKYLREEMKAMKEEESFFLTDEDIALIIKGRKEYDDGKAVSGEQLMKEVEAC